MKCLVCNKEFECSKFHPNQRTCGKFKCQQLLYRILNKEKIALSNRVHREKRWFGGNRDVVLKRDGSCVKCGSNDKLHVHHKNGVGRGHHNPDNSLDNLVTLCNSCHQKFHNRYNISNNQFYILAVKKLNGHSTREVGKLLGISHTTVRVIRNGLGKLEKI